MREKRGVFACHRAGQLCCLALLCALWLLPAGALAADKAHWDGDGDRPASVARVGELLYVRTNQGLYQYSLTGGEARLLYDVVSLAWKDISTNAELIGGERALYVDLNTALMYPVSGRTLGAPQDVAGTVLSDERMRRCDLFVQGEHVYMLGTDADANEDQYRIHKLNLETLRADVSAQQGFCQIMPYREGELLARRIVRSAQAYSEIVTVDMRSLEVKEVIAPLPELSDGGIAYDAQSGRLLACLGGMLCEWTAPLPEAGEWRPIRAVSVPMFPLLYGCTRTHYISASSKGVFLYDTEDFRPQTVLRILGTRAAELNEFDFMTAYPDIVLTRTVAGHFCAEEIYTAVTTGDDSADLYCLPLSTGVRTLAERGFLEPLSGSAALRDDHGRLHASIGAPLAWEGEIYAVPFTISLTCWQMREAEAAEQPPPRTIAALMEGMEAWEAGGAPGPYVSYAHNAQDWRRMDYLTLLYEQYVLERYDPEQALFFDSEFEQLLERMSGCAQEGFTQRGGGRTDDAVNGTYAVNEFFSLGGRNADGLSVFTPPAVEKGARPHVPARMGVYVVNPNSPNKAAAMAYLEYIAAHRGAQTQSLLDASWAEETMIYEDFVQSLRENIENLEQQLAEASEEDRATLEDAIAQLKAQIAHTYADPQNYVVYAPLLAQYKQEIAPRLTLRDTSPYLQNAQTTHGSVYTNMLELLSRCAAGELPAKACVRQMNALGERVFAEQVMR